MSPKRIKELEPGKVYVTNTGTKVKLVATGRNPEVVFVKNIETDSEFWLNIDRVKGLDGEVQVIAPAKTKDAPAKEPAPRAEKKATKAKATRESSSKKISALDAAAKVLMENGEPMNCQELIEAMAAKGYWSSPNGKTPASTLYAAITREIGTKGKDARFVKTERGMFAAK